MAEKKRYAVYKLYGYLPGKKSEKVSLCAITLDWIEAYEWKRVNGSDSVKDYSMSLYAVGQLLDNWKAGIDEQTE